MRVASSLAAADKPASAPDLSALSDFASGVRQALNLTPQERKAQAQIAEAQAALARQKQQTEERDRRIASLEQRLAALPKQSDNAQQQVWQEKLAAAQAANDKARQRYEQDRKRPPLNWNSRRPKPPRRSAYCNNNWRSCKKSRKANASRVGSKRKT